MKRLQLTTALTLPTRKTKPVMVQYKCSGHQRLALEVTLVLLEHLALETTMCHMEIKGK